VGVSKPECVDCKTADPRPAVPRPIDPRSGPRKPRCATHYRAHKAAAKVRAHDTYVRKTYGLSEGEYWRLYEAQGRKCAFPRCRATGKVKRRLAVDHDRDMAVNICGHERDKGCRACTRGLLCHGHNYELMGKYAGDLEDAHRLPETTLPPVG
jgi:hypothetical protein